MNDECSPWISVLLPDIFKSYIILQIEKKKTPNNKMNIYILLNEYVLSLNIKSWTYIRSSNKTSYILSKPSGNVHRFCYWIIVTPYSYSPTAFLYAVTLFHDPLHSFFALRKSKGKPLIVEIFNTRKKDSFSRWLSFFYIYIKEPIDKLQQQNPKVSQQLKICFIKDLWK